MTVIHDFRTNSADVIGWGKRGSYILTKASTTPNEDREFMNMLAQKDTACVYLCEPEERNHALLDEFNTVVVPAMKNLNKNNDVTRLNYSLSTNRLWQVVHTNADAFREDIMPTRNILTNIPLLQADLQRTLDTTQGIMLHDSPSLLNFSALTPEYNGRNKQWHNDDQSTQDLHCITLRIPTDNGTDLALQENSRFQFMGKQPRVSEYGETGAGIISFKVNNGKNFIHRTPDLKGQGRWNYLIQGHTAPNVE